MAGKKGISHAFLWLIALACVLGGWFQIDRTLTLQGTYEDAARQHANDYRRRAAEEITRSCYPLAANERGACINAANQAARTQEREEYDLEAQRITAAWTAAMGSAAIIGMFVGILGVYLVYTTFHETRRANEITKALHEPTLEFYVNCALAGGGVPAAVTIAPQVSGERSAFEMQITCEAHIPSIFERALLEPHESNVIWDVHQIAGRSYMFDLNVPDPEAAAGQFVTVWFTASYKTPVGDIITRAEEFRGPIRKHENGHIGAEMVRIGIDF